MYILLHIFSQLYILGDKHIKTYQLQQAIWSDLKDTYSK